MIYDKINNPNHKHKLKLLRCKIPYKCDGCKQIGFGSQYRCDACNSDLHKDCAFAARSIPHPFFENCDFRFFPKPPGPRERICDACGMDVQGFVYHCEKHKTDLHPCCANLPRSIGSNKASLELRPEVSSSCNRCGSKDRRKENRSWSYVSTCGRCCFHVSCMVEQIVERCEKRRFGESSSTALAFMDNTASNLQLTVRNGGSSGEQELGVHEPKNSNMIDDKINHASHEHELKLLRCETPYWCDGCKQNGFGSRYSCEACNYDLHKDCAFAAPSIPHPFFENCDFRFFPKPPGTCERICDACGMDVQGFVYHCEKYKRDLHPCCANLQHSICSNEVSLELRPKVSSSCNRCGWKERRMENGSWSYVSTCGGYCFHVSCVEEEMAQRWEKLRFGESSTALALMDDTASNLLLTVRNGGSSGERKLGVHELQNSKMIYDKINNPNHKHKLKLLRCKIPYKCDGCKQIGFESRYRCDACNSDLHKDCAFAAPSILPPFFENCDFRFFPKPPGPRERICDACGMDVQGFVYHCEKSNRDLHPCCAKLPRSIGSNEASLELRPKVSSSCNRCGWKERRKENRSWSYVSICGRYCFHVSCMVEQIVDRWEKLRSGESSSTVLALMDDTASNLQLTVRNGGSSASGNSGTCWRIFKMALKFIISVLVGDPTEIVGGLITALVLP